MNKLKTFLFVILLNTIISCKSTAQDKIQIKQGNNNEKVILKLAKDENKIIRINFPNQLSIINNSILDISFVKIKYAYNKTIPSKQDLNIELFQISDLGIKPISSRGKKDVKTKQKNEYVYYTRHFLDSTENTQKHFSSYAKKMLLEGKDTLHIGTVKEFKQKHKKVFERLTKNDSISIQFLDNRKLGTLITVPVEW